MVKLLCPAMAVKDPTFRSWFGSSRAVDERGLPLLLYHGTEKDFDSFDHCEISRHSNRPAFWFSTHKACGFYGPRRVAVYLNTEKVLEAPSGDLTKWVKKALTDNFNAYQNDEDIVWDAVVFRDVIDGDTFADVWAVFEPTSLKSPIAIVFDHESSNIFN